MTESDASKTDLSEVVQAAIAKTLSQPKHIRSEAGSVENHSIAELIAAEKYLERKKAKACMQFIKVNSQ
ncbi:MAG: hypothetical protein LBI18_08280 [Planctomycetaceae bacterium]|jgi:hypothetical protein|nr:hypothetical protein [Planctomycetaceae bacterium]